jgi:hypothetical protein
MAQSPGPALPAACHAASQPASHAANHLTSSRLLTERTWSAASLNNLLLSPAKACPYFVYLVQRLDLDLDLDLDVDLNLDLPGAKFKIPIVSEGELCSVSI